MKSVKIYDRGSTVGSRARLRCTSPRDLGRMDIVTSLALAPARPAAGCIVRCPLGLQ